MNLLVEARAGRLTGTIIHLIAVSSVGQPDDAPDAAVSAAAIALRLNKRIHPSRPMLAANRYYAS